jgi:hypothetical protein
MRKLFTYVFIILLFCSCGLFKKDTNISKKTNLELYSANGVKLFSQQLDEPIEIELSGDVVIKMKDKRLEKEIENNDK